MNLATLCFVIFLKFWRRTTLTWTARWTESCGSGSTKITYMMVRDVCWKFESILSTSIFCISATIWGLSRNNEIKIRFCSIIGEIGFRIKGKREGIMSFLLAELIRRLFHAGSTTNTHQVVATVRGARGLGDVTYQEKIRNFVVTTVAVRKTRACAT